MVGPRALNFFNIAWLDAGDPAAHYLGWLFYRHSPWGFPIGLNHYYGLEIANSILYSDSNPLLAFLFKPLSFLLPDNFQYFGIWLLVCFLLQAWFGWKLVGLITDSVLIRFLSAGFFVFAPPMLWRLSGHLNLVGHFVIVAALYLAFNPKLERRRLAWGAVLVVSALVHGYLLAIVALIWLADFCGRVVKKPESIRESVLELFILILIIGFVCWQVGYFSVGSGTIASGFGFYRMNLLSIIDSSGWSYLLKRIPQASGDYEGFNYLGLGVILLFVWNLQNLAHNRGEISRIIGKYPHLFIILIVFSVFAVSNNVAIGLVEFKYPLPDFVLRFANVFRASGRFFWPVFYVITFATVYFVIKMCERRMAVVALGLALIIQVVDTSAGWLPVRKRLMVKPASRWSTVLVDPFWMNAAKKYKKVRYIPVENNLPKWQVFAYYAGSHGLATDAIYLARVGSIAVENAQKKALQVLMSGNFERDSLYILDDASFRGAAVVVDRATDLVARIDGFNVIGPGWNICTDCRCINNAEVR